MAKDLNVSLGLIVKDFQRGIKQAKRDLRSFARQTQEIGRELTNSVTLPLGTLGVAAIKSAADIEKLESQLIATSKSAIPVQDQLQRLRKIAEAPGLGFEQAVKASARLQALEFSAQQAEEVITQFGNAVARSGGGAAEFDGVTLALGQIVSKGKITAEEINQLNERIFEIRPALENAFGTSNTEALQELGISSEEFVAKITKEFSKLDRVAPTLANSIENTGISIKLFASEIGGLINDLFKVQDRLNSFSTSLDSAGVFIRRLTPETQKLVLNIAGIGIAAGPAFLIMASGARVLKSLLPAAGLAVTGLKKVIASTILFADYSKKLIATSIALRKGNITLGAAFTSLAPRVSAAAASFRALNLATKGGVLLGITLAVAAASAAFKIFKKRIDQANAVNKVFADVNSQAVKSIAAERTTMERLVSVAQNESRSKVQRIQAIKKLQAISPKYFSNLNLEKDSLVRLTGAAKNYNEELLRSAKIKAAENALIKINEKLFDTQEIVSQSAPNFFQNIANVVTSLGNVTSFAGKSARSFTKNINENRAALERQKAAIVEFLEANQESSQIGGNRSNIQPPVFADSFKRSGKETEEKEIAKIPKEELEVITIDDILPTEVVGGFFESQKLFDDYRLGLKRMREEAALLGKGDLVVLSEQISITEQALLSANEKFGFNSEQVKALSEDLQSLTDEQVKFNKQLSISNAVTKILGPAFDNVFNSIASGGKNAFKAFTDSIKQLLIELGKAVIKAAVFAGILSLIPGGTALTGIGGFKGLLGQFAGFNTIALADGGIIPNRRYLTGEEGAEAVIPLDRAATIPVRIEMDDIRISGTDLVLAMRQSEGVTNRLFG